MQSFSAKHEMWEEKEKERERTESGRDRKQPTIDLVSQKRSDAHEQTNKGRSTHLELEASVVLDLDGVFRVTVLGHLLPDGVDVGSVEVSSSIPSPAPD